MRLSTRDMTILALYELRGQATIGELAKLTGLRAHAVGYTTSRLEHEGILGAIRPSVNSYRYGFCHYGFFIKLARIDNRRRRKLEVLMNASPSVAWCAEVGGGYHYALAIMAADPLSAHVSFSLLRDKDLEFSEVSPVIRLSVESYGRKYLSPLVRKLEPLWYGREVGNEKIDLDDMKILKALFSAPSGRFSEAVKIAGIPLSTLLRRIRELERREVITGYYRVVDPRVFGVQIFNVQIKNIDLGAKGAHARFKKFVAAYPTVVHAIECLGSWEHEIILEVFEIREVSEFLDLLSAQFEQPIDAEVIPVFRYLKFAPQLDGIRSGLAAEPQIQHFDEN